MSERAETCANCLYWQPENSAKIGECRIRSVPTTDFPLRDYRCWCGEWLPKMDEPEKQP
jgi:hypothetical protein